MPLTTCLERYVSLSLSGGLASMYSETFKTKLVLIIIPSVFVSPSPNLSVNPLKGPGLALVFLVAAFRNMWVICLCGLIFFNVRKGETCR